ncbi:MAG: hypothetical protein EOS48_24780 [Mesorhizobium sp.]|nr:MAG: hypothetical protein EOS48_24780 [Mesorhizobium sp.]
MGISDCDPIRFGLLFKRSISRDRIGVDVADSAIMSDGRHKVIGSASMAARLWIAQTKIGNEQPPAAASCRDCVMKRWALITRLASAFREFVAPRYRPELHYMRGPGPACARRVRAR